ncbi:MAG: hypothetical protein HUK03_10120, partial [Bacteroidaceae bacterium]|nr:hypothetical protein [Bacteroidaceae bacterium]
LDTKKDRNYVFFHAKETDARGSLFTEVLRKEMSQRGITPQTIDWEATDEELEVALNRFKDNCVIPDNTSVRTLNILIAKLNAFRQMHPDYVIALQGYPEWQAYTSSHLSDMYKFGTYIYTSYYKNPMQPSTAAFENTFYRLFHRQPLPSFPQFGMFGFDLGYYFLHGLANLGDTFAQRNGELRYKPFQHPFRFQPMDNEGGYTNTHTQLVHYTTRQTLEIITPR